MAQPAAGAAQEVLLCPRGLLLSPPDQRPSAEVVCLSALKQVYFKFWLLRNALLWMCIDEAGQ